MSLKSIILAKRLTEKRTALAALTAKDKDFEARAEELRKAYEEVTAETPAEDRAAVESEMEKYDEEAAAHEEEKKNLQREIEETENELAETESRQGNRAPEDTPAPETERSARSAKGEYNTMSTRTNNIFGTRTRAEIEAMMKRDDVSAWLAEYRAAIREKRAIQNVGLTIPDVFMPIIRENTARFSKLYNRVTVVRVRGEGKQNLSGAIPEGVWTECCAKLNELSWGFFQESFGCYMVGGYYVLCNANIEDSDIDLAAEILGSFGKSIGLALDKAMVWGRNIAANSSMPQGIVPSLAQESKPADWSVVAPEWEDLHESNIISVGSVAEPLSGVELVAALVEASGAVETDYSQGDLLWLANGKTYRRLMASTIVPTAAGGFSSAVSGAMPVIGGDFEVLNFLPDDVVVFGYFDLYELVERKGVDTATSEHVRFLANETVFKGVARYDGKPVIRKAFGVALINGAQLDLTDVTFPQDAANRGN